MSLIHKPERWVHRGTLFNIAIPPSDGRWRWTASWRLWSPARPKEAGARRALTAKCEQPSVGSGDLCNEGANWFLRKAGRCRRARHTLGGGRSYPIIGQSDY